MIVKYCVYGFKGLREFCADLNQLVIIHGPPASGKTSIVESIGLLIQSRGEDWIVLEGHYVVFHEPSEIHYNGDLNNPIRWEVHVNFGGRILGYEYEYKSSGNWARQSIYRNFVKLITVERFEDGGVITHPPELSGVRTCIPPVPVINEVVLTPCHPVENEQFKSAEYAIFELRNLLKDSVYILTDRRPFSWKRTFEASVDLLPEYSVGSDGQYTVHQLSRISADPALEREREEIDELLREIGIDEVSTGIVARGRIGGYVRMGRRISSILHAGLFVRSLLPLIVQLVLAKSESTVIVDDLELGVPEDSYERIADILGKFARRKGLQLVATTRSTSFAKIAERLGYQVVKVGASL